MAMATAPTAKSASWWGPGRFLLGLFAGLGVTGTLQGVTELVSREPGWMRESITLAAGGNLLTGLVFVPMTLLVAWLRPQRGTWMAGRGLTIGLAIGLLPILGVIIVQAEWYRGHTTVALWLLPVLMLVAAKIPAQRLPGTRGVVGLLALSIGAWWWAGGRGLEPAFAVAPLEGDPEIRAQFDRPGGPTVSESAPDIVLVSCDTLRGDAVVGEIRAKVPHLDALAARGMTAPYARSGSNCTLPGHIEMFSGMGPLEHGIVNNSGVTPEEIPILGELFAEAGWNTCAVISNRVIERRFGPSRGFEIWDDTLGTGHDHLARLGQKTLLGWVSDRALFDASIPFLFFGQQEVQAEWGSREGERTAQTAIARIQDLSASTRPYLLAVHFMDAHDPYRAPAQWLNTRSAAPGPSWPGYDEVRARYWEEVDYLDFQLGRLFEALEATGRPHVILITGDHGEHLGEQAMVGHSDELYEPVVGVPFLLAGPGVPAGVEVGPVSLSDVAPTLLALAGLSIPAEMTGQDVRTLTDLQREERFLFARDERSVSAVIGSYKWAADWPRGEDAPREGLFRDLTLDPGETGGALQDVPDGLLDEIKRRLGEAILRGHEDLSPERRAALAALGYVDSANE